MCSALRLYGSPPTRLLLVTSNVILPFASLGQETHTRRTRITPSGLHTWTARLEFPSPLISRKTIDAIARTCCLTQSSLSKMASDRKGLEHGIIQCPRRIALNLFHTCYLKEVSHSTPSLLGRFRICLPLLALREAIRLSVLVRRPLLP